MSEQAPPQTEKDKIVSWEKVEEERTTFTDRPLSEYQRLLGLSLDNLVGKTVLDIGSGEEQRFANEAARNGINVISVNPAFKMDKWLRRAGRKRYSVAARGQELPFKDESFDAVTSVFAVPHYITEESSVSAVFNEVARVLKPGGKAYLYSEHSSLRSKIEKAERELKDRGLNVQIDCITLKGFQSI